MRFRIRLDQIALVLASFVIGVFSNVLANFVSSGGWLVMLFFFILLLVSVILLMIYRPVLIVRFGPPISLRTENEARRYARRGLIAFVSLYNPYKIPPSDRLSPEQIRTALDSGNFKILQLEKSSLEPVIKAIVSHQSRLEHCWLISTNGPNGSERFVDILVDYLKKEKGITGCQFHTHEQYVLAPPSDDVEVLKKIRDLVDDIFKEAKKEYQLEAKEIIADVTSGFRSMSLGMTFSCLDARRDIEFSGSQYDEHARPTGEPVPMIFEFEVQTVARAELP